MKKIKVKKLAAVLAAALLVSVFAGCTKTADETVSTAEEVIEEAVQTAEEEKPEEESEPKEETEPEAEEQPGKEAVSDEDAAQEETTVKGDPIMCFSGEDLDKNPVNTQDIFAKNKVTVVNIWASWCGPCVGEIPELDKINSELKEKGCGVVGYLLDGEDPEGLKDAKEILSETKATYTNIIFSESKADELGIQAVPTTYFMNSKGEIVGEPVIGADPDSYMKTVDSLLSGM